MKFEELDNIPAGVLNYLSNNKIVDMTEIQRQTYKHIINNKDVIACSGTGTGKTIAFLLPIIAKLNPDSKNIQALILAPTKELAIQIHNQTKELLDYEGSNFKSACMIGDVNINRQIEALKSKPSIVIGTPNRILQLIKDKKMKVHEVKTLVLDEADKLLDKTFEKDVNDIRHCLMKFTQVLLFSASINKKARNTTLTFKPIFIDINNNTGNESPIPKNIKHIVILSDRRERIETLRKIIKASGAKKAIIFINSKYDLEESLQKLQYHNYSVVALSSQLNNNEKKAALDNFKNGKISFLIATDVAARGLQVDDIDTVINVNLPEENNEYIHRCGRCGRNGNNGTCISIITDNEYNKIKKYQKDLKINIVERKLYQGKMVAK